MIGIVDYNAGNIKSVERALSFLGADYVLSKNPRDLENADRLIFPGVGEAKYAMEQLKKTGFDSFLRDWARAGKTLLGICLGSQIIFDHSEEGDVDCLGILPGTIRHFSRVWGDEIVGSSPTMTANMPSATMADDNVSHPTMTSGTVSCPMMTNGNMPRPMMASGNVSCPMMTSGNVPRPMLTSGNVSFPCSTRESLKVPHMGWNDVTYTNGGNMLFDGIPEHSDFYFVHSYVIQPADASIVKATADYGCPVPACVSQGSVTAFQFHPEKSGRVGLKILENYVK